MKEQVKVHTCVYLISVLIIILHFTHIPVKSASHAQYARPNLDESLKDRAVNK